MRSFLLRNKRYAFVLIQIIVGGMAIFFVWRQLRAQNIAEALASFAPTALIPFFILAVSGVMISAWRWTLLMRAFGLSVSVWRALGANGYAVWYGLFLPGQITGEALKGFHVGASKQDAVPLAASILWDKLFGAATLLLVGAGAAWMMPAMPAQMLVWLAASGMLAVVLLALFTFASIPAWFARVPVVGILFTSSLRPRGRLFLPLMLLGALAHLLVSAEVAVLARGFGIENIAAPALAYVLSSAFTLVPITFAGIGIREGVFVWVFHLLNIPVETGVLLAEGLLLTNILYGFGAWAFGLCWKFFGYHSYSR